MQWIRIRHILNIVDPEQVVPNSSILEKCESGSESHVVLWHSETGFIVELLDPLMQKKLRIPYAMDPDPTYPEPVVPNPPILEKCESEPHVALYCMSRK